MKKEITLIFTAASLSLGAFSQCPVSDQPLVTDDFSMACSADTILSLASSEIGVKYFLRDNSDNSIIDGPISGTGGAISLATGNISSSATMNVYAKVENVHPAVDVPTADDHIRYAAPFTAYSDEITVEAWVYKYSGDHPWAGQSGDAFDGMATNVWLWHCFGGTMEFYVNDAGTWRLIGMPILPLGWTHVATVANSSGLFIYYNGILVASNNAAITTGIVNNPTSVIDLGHDPRFPAGTPGRNANVAFDDFRIWNYARSNSEIIADMNSCLTGTEPGLVQYTTFGEGAGTSVTAVTGASGAIMNPTSNWITSGGGCTGVLCDLEMSELFNIFIDPIFDLDLSPDMDTLCSPQSVSVTVEFSQPGLNYFLRDDVDDLVIDGPVSGNGGDIILDAGLISSDISFNVYAMKGPSFDGAIELDGVNQYINVPTLTGTANFTVEAWIYKQSSPGTWTTLFEWANDAPWIGFSDMEKLHVWGTSAEDPDLFPMSGWHHVAITCGGWDTYLYVDGVQKAYSSIVPPDMTGSGFGIGFHEFEGPFQGQIDEVRVWDVVRTPAEIIASMNTCLTGGEANLMAYWNFSDGPGSATVTDQTGNGHTGLLTGSFDLTTDWVPGPILCIVCELEMSEIVLIDLQAVDTSVTVSGMTLTANASGTGFSYLWYDCDSGTLVPFESDQTFSPTLSGNYALIVTENGCTDTSACYPVLGAGWEELNEQLLSVFPNPTEGTIDLVMTGSDILEIKVYSAPGKLVYSMRPVDLATKVDLGFAESGAYLVEVVTVKGVIRKTVVVQ